MMTIKERYERFNQMAAESMLRRVPVAILHRAFAHLYNATTFDAERLGLTAEQICGMRQAEDIIRDLMKKVA